jgi:hypothetical protein
MKTATISERPTAVSSRRAETPTLGQASAEFSSNKSTGFSGWPFFWWTQAATDLLRTWGEFSQLGLRPATGQRFATTTTQVPVARPEVDPPTSGDRLFHAMMGRLTAGVSPASLGLAYADWAFHLAASPGKWQLLLEKAVRKAVRLATCSLVRVLG